MEWKGHNIDSLEKLRVALDSKFEYVDHELSMVGFGNVVKRWLKTKKNKLKAQYMVGKRDCPPNIEPVGWERLKVYWSKHESKRKAKQMSNARSKVKNMGNVGQLGKTKKEAKLVLVDQPYQSYINICGVVTLFLFNHGFVMGFLFHSLM
jgi:hypothetical protein